MKKILILVFCTLVQLGYSQTNNNYELIDQPNNDSLLLIMISGYTGAENWNDFKNLLIKDDSLKRYDILIYGLDQDNDIKKNVIDINNVVNYHGAKYEEYFFVSFSFGGIITKQLILDDINSEVKLLSKIGYLVFIGTPHLNDNFTIGFIKKTLGFFIRPFVKKLLRDAAKSKKIKIINDQWLQEIEYSNKNYIGNIAIFGRDDELVKPEVFEVEIKGESIIISGTHNDLVKGIDENHCSYKIVRSKLINKNTDIKKVKCINP